jgi:hypothetical protein
VSAKAALVVGDMLNRYDHEDAAPLRDASGRCCRRWPI